MTDDSERRGRGRPKGSTRYEKEDLAALGQVADLLFRAPQLKLTAAIKLVTGKPDDESLTRRLRGKWQQNRPRLVEEAELRARQAAPALVGEVESQPAPTLGNVLIGLGHMANRFEGWLRSPKMQAFFMKIGEMAVRADAFLKTPEGQKLQQDLKLVISQMQQKQRRQRQRRARLTA